MESLLKIFPIFDIAHNLLATTEVRNELGGSNLSFSRTHPFACWLLTITFIFSGSLTANLLLGRPLIDPLANTKTLLVATTIWYFVFFSPFDTGYKVGLSLPIKLVAGILNEIYRAQKVRNGLLQAAELYPNSWIIMIAVATIRGNGSGLIKLLIRLIRKTQTAKDAGFMQISLSTKVSVLAASLLVFEREINWFRSQQMIYIITAVFIYLKISSLLWSASHSGLPFESWFHTKLFDKCQTNKDKELSCEVFEKNHLMEAKKDS